MPLESNGKVPKKSKPKKTRDPEWVDEGLKPTPAPTSSWAKKITLPDDLDDETRLTLNLAITEAAKLIDTNELLRSELKRVNALATDLRQEMQYRRGVARKCVKLATSTIGAGESCQARLSAIAKLLEQITDTVFDLIAVPPPADEPRPVV